MTIAQQLETIWQMLPRDAQERPSPWMINHLIELACHFANEPFDKYFRMSHISAQLVFPDKSRLIITQPRDRVKFKAYNY